MATHPSVEVPRAESPNDRVQPAPLCLGLAGLSNAQPHIWRWCPACVSQDIESYGMAYWHRTHQLPSVLLCPFHGLPLHEVRIPYWARQKCFLDPETLQPDLDSADSWPTDSCADSALEIARFAQMALNAEDGEATPAIVRGAILDGLSTLGLIGRKSDIHPKEFANSFLESHGRLANIDHFSLYLNAKTLARLAKTMNASPVMLPPTLSVMIAHWLFGSWDLFRAHCEWRRAIDTPATLSHAHRLQAESFARAPDQSREEHRQICMKFMTSVSVASRTDFWHAHPKSCRWLAQYDRDWFDSTLPTAKTYAPKQLELFWAISGPERLLKGILTTIPTVAHL
jgi:hypothetical protein